MTNTSSLDLAHGLSPKSGPVSSRFYVPPPTWRSLATLFFRHGNSPLMFHDSQVVLPKTRCWKSRLTLLPQNSSMREPGFSLQLQSHAFRHAWVFQLLPGPVFLKSGNTPPPFHALLRVPRVVLCLLTVAFSPPLGFSYFLTWLFVQPVRDGPPGLDLRPLHSLDFFHCYFVLQSSPTIYPILMSISPNSIVLPPTPGSWRFDRDFAIIGPLPHSIFGLE